MEPPTAGSDATSVSPRIAAEVRALMARTRISRAQLAHAVGISGARLTRRLNGLVPFDVDELVLVALALGTTSSALVRETEDDPR